MPTPNNNYTRNKPTGNNTGKKEFASEWLTGFYTAKNNDSFFYSLEIDPRTFEALQKCEIGGKLFFALIPEENRKNENSPHARLLYMSADEVKKSTPPKRNFSPKRAETSTDDDTL